ncbi:MAG TPA: hypothetical protein VGP89_07030, partial [Candidatus Angelobacter sp.]|nr:hypothetical protein [Candidatus Angelobacter sp.]
MVSTYLWVISILIPLTVRSLFCPVINFYWGRFEFQYHKLGRGLAGIADGVGFRIIPHELTS